MEGWGRALTIHLNPDPMQPTAESRGPGDWLGLCQ